MANAVTTSLTKKIGPLAAWQWGAIIGVAGLGYKFLRGGGRAEEAAVVNQQLIPTGAMQIDPSSGFLNELSVAINKLRDTQQTILDKIKNPTTSEDIQPVPDTVQPTPGPISAKPPPTLEALLSQYEQERHLTNSSLNQIVVAGGGLPLLVMRLRRALGFDPNQPTYQTAQNIPGETATARQARLTAEYNILADQFRTVI